MNLGSAVYGSVTGTGATINVSLGFVPVAVLLMNQTDAGLGIWTASMTNAHALKLTDAPALSHITSLGISPYAGSDTPGSEAAAGFSIGADTDLNAASDVIHYIAFKGEAAPS